VYATEHATSCGRRAWAAGISSFVPLRNVREDARDFGNENFHCGSFLVTVHHRGSCAATTTVS